MPISLTIQLVLAAIVLLAFGFGSTGRALRFLSGGAALLIAIAGTAATIGLFWVGQKNDWTSDGPGMLGVMIAIVVCGIAATVGWIFVFGVATTARAPVDALPDAPRDVKRVLRLIGFALLGIAVVGQVITAVAGRGRAAHAAPVVAVSFATGRPRLVTVDAAGTLVDWDLHLKRETRRETIPELAGATELFVDATAERAFAVANGKALRFEPFADTPVDTIAGARHIARGGAVVVAKDQALIFAPYSDWKTPHRELAWAEPISAIAANDTFLAVADRTTISLLDGRPSSVRLIASVPTPGAISRLAVLHDGIVVALDGSGAAWAIDVRRVVTGRWRYGATLVASARHVFLVSGREVKKYDPATGAATVVAKIGSGARSIDTWDKHVAFGFEDGEVVLGTLTGGKLETERLTRLRVP